MTPPLSLSRVAQLCDGRLSAADPSRVIVEVVADTRRLSTGGVFVALEGARDGHEFLADALSRGAAAAVVRDGATAPEGLATIAVDYPLAALWRLASGVRWLLRSTVVAITGSSGKTCTKDFTAQVLAGTKRVSAAEGSFNNEIGVPLTVLAAGEDTEVLVAEVGSRGVGQIRALIPVLAPEIGVVTNVGVAHVGMFGSVEAVAQAKGELVEALPPEGAAVLNADDPRVRGMAERTAATIIDFGVSGSATVRAEAVQLDEDACAEFKLVTPDGAAPVRLPVPGSHMVSNALAAAAVAHRLGMGVQQIAERLATVRAPRLRMELCQAPGGWRVVNDAYNANPSSVAAALRALRAMKRTGRTWAVLGLMAELGDSSRAEHDRVGRLAVRLGIDRLVVVGEEARVMCEAARLEGLSAEDAVWVPDADAAIDIVRTDVAAGDVVLVKASRVVCLERVAEELIR